TTTPAFPPAPSPRAGPPLGDLGVPARRGRVPRLRDVGGRPRPTARPVPLPDPDRAVHRLHQPPDRPRLPGRPQPPGTGARPGAGPRPARTGGSVPDRGLHPPRPRGVHPLPDLLLP